MSKAERIADDFRAAIRIFRFDEGGRKSPAFMGIRWDLRYADDPPGSAIFMIWPDFIDEVGKSLPIDTPLVVDQVLLARMTVVVDEMRAKVHRSRITVGTRFYCCEGPKLVAEGCVTKITGLFLDR